MGSRSRDRGGGGCWGPVAELSLPRFAILTAVLPAPPLPLDKAIRTDALFHGQHILPRDCASIFLCLQKRHFWASAPASAPYVIPVS